MLLLKSKPRTFLNKKVLRIYIIEAEFLEDKNYILVSESFTDFLNSFFNE
ncbi:hypothetical protein CCAN2_1990040 [Capnocytophaga canimorsus]|nr:hypothetical protein CCAN2_1990040 [Capnocytophaga canimorsus]